jgi:hypothetical protein
MAMTINSGFAPYCTPVQFCLEFDFRTFAQLASDNDVPLSQTNPAPLQASPVLYYKLQVGAGLIEAACTKSARYDPTDLAALVTPVGGIICNSGNLLIKINAGISAFEMYGRRYEGISAVDREKIEMAQGMLSALEDGQAIFAFGATQQAGLLTDYRETPCDVEQRHMPSTVARRCLGIRDNQRYPRG